MQEKKCWRNFLGFPYYLNIAKCTTDLFFKLFFIIYYSNPVMYLLIWEKTGQVCDIKQ